MGKAPAFQFYAGDRAMDLMGLDNEACGAWIRAVMYLWTTGPASEERVALASGKGWERVRFMFSDFDGRIGLQWMEDAREKQRVFRENASEYGAKGGRPSKRKKGTLSKPKGNPNPTQRVGSMKIEGEVEDEIESESKRNAREPEVELIPAGMSVELHRAIKRWEQYRKEKRNTLTPSGRTAFLKKCEAWGDLRAIAAIDHSIAQGWTGCFEPKTDANGTITGGRRSTDPADAARRTAEYFANKRAGQPFEPTGNA